ncbi:hypothetical protein KIH41_11580 [Litoribacter ruber]|uniref:DUF5074 domain-containing protein n=1 Tax=Litoribacter ruber TaxID=702568 RepID=UPI001BDB2F10|nr:DUF5074 domain-containing protein [Litoribacter ruber]MBT0811919.1 hypothetical protein [Litoribacter ruber]
MKTNFKISFVFLCSALIALGSCNNDAEIIENGNVPFGEGIFVVNEGNTQTNTGEITFFNPSTGDKSQNIFSKVNDMDLGIYVQSIHGHLNKGYISVDNMNRLYVVNLDNFELEGIVEEIGKPQGFLGLNEQKGYVSLWGESGTGTEVAVINLQDYTVSKRITVGTGPKEMLLNGNDLIVLNSGGFSSANSISIINTQNDEVTQTITVGDNPNSLVSDRSGNIWVLCGGRYKSDWSGLETPGQLLKINGSNYSIEEVLDFESEFSQPSRLRINSAGDELYFTYDGHVRKLPMEGELSQGEVLLNRSFYGFAYNPNDGMLYGTDPRDFASSGWVIRFSPEGVLQDSIQAGIIPSQLLFNY